MIPQAVAAALAVAGGVVALVAAGWGASGWQAREQRERGAALYAGEVPLAGRLFGHEGVLPATATRCRNCHEPSAVPAGPAGLGAYAATLNAASLQTARPRRGGPPSAFDAARLCALLREGVDPAHVMIATTMPRYDITDAQCEDLWAYLRSR